MSKGNIVWFLTFLCLVSHSWGQQALSFIPIGIGNLLEVEQQEIEEEAIIVLPEQEETSIIPMIEAEVMTVEEEQTIEPIISDIVTTITIKPIDDMTKIYNDKGSGAILSISVWRPDLSAYPGYYSLGDVAMDSYERPATVYIVSADEDELMPPVDYTEVWTDAGSGGDQDGSFWQPVAPSGYVCLGNVAQNGYDKPSTDLIRCVKSSLVRPATTKKVWDDTSSGADHDIGVWEVVPNADDPRGVNMNLFVSVDNYAVPSGTVWVLDRDAVKSGSFLRYNMDLKTPFLFAPVIYLRPDEVYFPESPETFLQNTEPETIEGEAFLVTKEPLGCSDCTEPSFLYGTNPEEYDVPVYAMVVERTINNQPTVDFLYWTFYPYNKGKTVIDLRTYGNHVGDWEFVAVRFTDGYATKVFYSFHTSGFQLNWGDKRIAMADETHFIAFAAVGSHGYYTKAGNFNYNCGLAMVGIRDETGWGPKWETWRALVPFYWQEQGTYSEPVEFLNWAGAWGNPEEDCDIKCVLESGPTGPAYKGASKISNIYFGMSSEAALEPKEEFVECLPQMYGRGVGKVITACNEGEEKDGLLCYPYCDDGYYGVGPVCWQDCPSGFRDDGAFCAKPAPYGRGAGYVIWDESGCESDHPQGCERSGLLYYPKCDPGYYAFGCCICSPECQNGQTDIGVSCAKKTYGRGAGTPMGCEPGLELNGALCYPPCKPGYKGVGPICYMSY